MNKYSKNDFNRIWTWADTLCKEHMDGKSVGQMVVMPEFMQSIGKGDLVLVVEFDLEKRKAQENPMGGNIGEVMTGRQWVLKCTAKEENEMTLLYGLPSTKKYGCARFKIMEIVSAT